MSGTVAESTDVLLSVKPEFAEKILSDEKRYEFRKSGFRDESVVDSVLIYSSAPVQRIVGWFTLDTVVELPPERLWERFGSQSGIDDRDRFMSYFSGNDTGYAIAIDEVYQLSPAVDPWHHFDEFRPPVSFKYIEREIRSLLEQLALKIR
jgi:type I restriction enzyme S subunit